MERIEESSCDKVVPFIFKDMVSVPPTTDERIPFLCLSGLNFISNFWVCFVCIPGTGFCDDASCCSREPFCT